MTLVIRQNVAGRPIGAPTTLDRRRRRLSTVVARHADRRRPHIVSLHRQGESMVPTDASVRMRRSWARTLVGPADVVVITYLPLGGGGSSGGNSTKQIGAAVAMIALAVAAPYVVAGLGVTALGTSAGALTFAGKALAVGIIAGGGYLISRATQAKANKENQDTRPVYGVSGGGNLPRPGDRIPRGYGHIWTQPDLTQPDYIVNDGEDQILYRRMTLGLGHYRVQTIQVAGATMWTEAGGVQAPFTGAEVEIIPPGGTSSLVPATVISSQAVASQELPRPGDNPGWTGPFPVCPVGKTTKRVQIDFSLPQGCYANWTNPKTGASKQLPIDWQGRWEYAPCDDDNNPTGAFTTLVVPGGNANSTRALRFTRFVDVPEGRYVVRGRNDVADFEGNNNAIYWDGLRAHFDDVIVRPHVTEIAMRVRSGKELGVTAFADSYVEATAKVPVWDGSAWTLQETRKAVWAFADVLRGVVGGVTYGGGLPDDQIDVAGLLFRASSVTEYDTFDGIIRGPVSVHEAAATVLGVMRAEPARIGNAWTMTRDEPRAARRHVFSRRQIVKGSTATSFQVALSDGAADVIVEYNPDADPRRRREVRVTFGPQQVTPRRYNLTGITSHDHAAHHATWIAASAYYRRERRKFTSELEGRLVTRNDPALVDAWYMADGTRAAGVMARQDYTLTLDTDVEVVEGETYATFRDRQNREWGPVRVTAGTEPNVVVVNQDDVATVAAFYDTPFASIFTADGDEMTAVLIGPLTEIQSPYIIQSAEPQGRDRVAVEAIYDAPEVWTALGEAMPPAPPVPGVGDLTAPAVPTIPWLRATPVQKTTALEMEWAVGPVRGAASIIVDLSYDDWATSERVSEGLSTSGTYALRHLEDAQVKVRALAVSTGGVPGDVIEASFFTFKPVIADDTASIFIELQHLDEAVADILTGGPDVAGSVAEAKAAGDAARARFDDLRNAFSADPKVRAQVIDTTLTALRNDVRALSGIVAELHERQQTTDGALNEAGLQIDSPSGQARFYAFADLGSRITDVSVSLDALAAKVTLIANTVVDGNFDGIVDQITAVGIELDALNASLTQYVKTADLSAATNRITALEQDFDGLTGEITNRATKAELGDTNIRVTNVETTLSTIGEIAQTVTAFQSGKLDSRLMNGTLQEILALLNDLNLGTIGELATAKSTIGARIDDNGRAIASATLDLAAYKGTTAAQIAQAFKAIADGDTANSSAILGLSAQVNDATTGLPKVYADFVSFQETTADALAGKASSQSVQTLSAQLNDSTNGLSKTRADLLNEMQVRADGESALASRIDHLTTNVSNNSAAITTVSQAQADGDSALSIRIDQVTSTVSGNTASIQTVQGSVNGIAVKWSVEGHIDDTTGGFVFQGARQNNGTVVYDMEISSNVRIHGSVTIDGTLDWPKFAPSAIAQVIPVSGNGSASTPITVRAGSKVTCAVTFNGGTEYANPGSTGFIKIKRDGAEIGSTPRAWTLSSSNLKTTPLPTAITVSDNPGAGTHTYEALCSGGTTNDGTILLVVTEIVKAG